MCLIPHFYGICKEMAMQVNKLHFVNIITLCQCVIFWSSKASDMGRHGLVPPNYTDIVVLSGKKWGLYHLQFCHPLRYSSLTIDITTSYSLLWSIGVKWGLYLPMCNNVVRAQSFSAKKVLYSVVYLVGVLGELGVLQWFGLYHTLGDEYPRDMSHDRGV